MAEPESWKSYYWEFIKLFGKVCYRTWREEMLASVLVIGFVFLIEHESIGLRTGLGASAYTLATLAIWHFVRVPWLLQKRDPSLRWGWGIFGIAVMAGATALWLITAAWFYTLQPRVVINPRIPDSRDINIQTLNEQLATMHEPESEDSLRRRTMRLADEWTNYVTRRLADPNKPPTATPNSANPHPSAEEQKAMQKYQEFYRPIEQYYAEHFRPRFIGIIEEYKHVGVETHYLESTFAQFTPYPAPEGTVYVLDPLTLFRELAYHVDAKGHLIVL